ncbi:MAG: SIR2 family protein [Sulfurimonadaceae bacterium]
MENTLLFGNGLNQLTNSGPSWNYLLERLKENNTFKHDKLTNTLIYERIFLEREKPSLKKEIIIKEEVASMMEEISESNYYQKIINLGFKNYITTNYDYAFRKTLNQEVLNENTEKVYSIRRNLNFNNLKVWHIHGEINNPKSIQLGLDHYAGYISKIDSYIKGNYEYQKDSEPKKVDSIVEKLQNNKYDNVSWIELFFNTNIHILGLGLDYSEIDLWWILNKRARLMIDNDINNRIVFYTNKIDEQKRGLLNSFNVEVELIDKFNESALNEKNEKVPDYKLFTIEAINKIAKFKD